MAADDKTRYLKEQLASYLTREHPEVSLTKPFRCLNPEHQDTNPSMSYFAKTNIVKCFSCGATYDLFDLIRIDYNLPEFKDQKAKAEVFFPTGYISTAITTGYEAKKEHHKNTMENKLEPEPERKTKADFSGLYKEWHKKVKLNQYLKRRGLSESTIERFNLGYSPIDQSVIIPCTPGYYVKRSTKPGAVKYINLKNARVQLFNGTALSGHDPVFITEGAIDALSVIESGFQALALNSSTNTNLLINEIENRERIPKLILFLDNDPAGKAAQDKLTNYFIETGLNFGIATPPEPYKDANDFLLADPQALKQFLNEAITKEANMKPAETQKQQSQQAEPKKLNETSIVNHLNNFKNRKEETTVIATGFPELDKYLDGGLHEGLIILGAQSSLGKTTLAMQIALQAAEKGNEVLFYSLEQSTRELIAKLISCESDKQLTISEVRRIASDKEHDKQKMTVYENAIDQLYKAENLHIIEDKRSFLDIKKDLIDRTASARKPLVIIDYLQMLKTGNGYQTDKQATDQNISDLKQISKTHGIPVLAISSLNRASYNADISEAAFKESGAIEYSSDLLLGLQYTALEHVKTDEDKKKYNWALFDENQKKGDETREGHPREVQIKIIKNRNGMAGKRIYFDYYAAYNRFEKGKTPRKTNNNTSK